MKKYLWLIIGGIFLLLVLLFNFILFKTTYIEQQAEGGLVYYLLAGIIGLPCLITGTSGVLCLIIQSLFWFAVGAGIGWLIGRKS